MAEITQEQFNEMLQIAVAQGIGGGTYISRYSGEEIDARLSQVGQIAAGEVTYNNLSPAVQQLTVGKNLLDNWYFAGGGSQQGGGQFPINQRGATTYENSFTVDRWQSLYPSAAEVIIEQGGIRLGSYKWFRQKIQSGTSLIGRELTASVLLGSGELFSGSATFDGGETTFFSLPDSVTCRVQILSSGPDVFFRIVNYSAGSTDFPAIVAVKLELGIQQTLAHQESGAWALNEVPDFSAELLMCQRYFQLFSAPAARPNDPIDCRPTMAAIARQGEITVGGRTLYYNSAEA